MRTWIELTTLFRKGSENYAKKLETVNKPKRAVGKNCTLYINTYIMFTLRRISGAGIQINQIIGKTYSFISRAANPEQYGELFKSFFHKDHVPDLDKEADNDTKRCYGFIAGDITQPLYDSQKNYIMTSDGKTFDNISFKW